MKTLSQISWPRFECGASQIQRRSANEYTVIISYETSWCYMSNKSGLPEGHDMDK
jgi:hypothetical protein